MRKTLSFVLAFLIVLGVGVHANAQSSSDILIYNSEPQLMPFDVLAEEIRALDRLEVSSIKEFYLQNKAYIRSLEESILLLQKQTGMPLNEVVNQIFNTGGERFATARKDALLGTRGGTGLISDYFNSCTYHYRSGYYTYSMEPKLSTRLLRPVCSNGWDALADAYDGIQNDNGSLSDQYWCHFEAFIEADWDIEEGCPNVGFLQTVLALCNPCFNAD